MLSGTPTATRSPSRAAARLRSEAGVGGQVRDPPGGGVGVDPAGQPDAGFQFVEGELAQPAAGRGGVAGGAGQHLPVVVDQPQLGHRPAHLHPEGLDDPGGGDACWSRPRPGRGPRRTPPSANRPARCAVVTSWAKAWNTPPAGFVGRGQGHLDRELVAVARAARPAAAAARGPGRAHRRRAGRGRRGAPPGTARGMIRSSTGGRTPAPG